MRETAGKANGLWLKMKMLNATDCCQVPDFNWHDGFHFCFIFFLSRLLSTDQLVFGEHHAKIHVHTDGWMEWHSWIEKTNPRRIQFELWYADCCALRLPSIYRAWQALIPSTTTTTKKYGWENIQWKFNATKTEMKWLNLIKAQGFVLPWLRLCLCSFRVLSHLMETHLKQKLCIKIFFRL